MKNFIFCLLFTAICLMNKAQAQNMAINTDGSLPDSSAMVDIASTSKGFLAPRMTTTEQNAIPLPAKGLLVFNITDNEFRVNTGTSASPVWTTLTSSSNNWLLTGNPGSDSATNFLGTTDNKSLRFRTNNEQRMILDTTGRVGIGSTAFDETYPEKLLVDGDSTINNVITATSDINDYVQIGVLNKNNGNLASSDFVATNDSNQYYIDLGINSTSYNNSYANILNHPNTPYLYAASVEDFYIGNGAPNKSLVFFTNGGNSLNGNNSADGTERIRITNAGNVGIGDFSFPVPSPAYFLTVKGTIAPYASNGAGSGNLGSTTNRWGTVYAQNALNTSSDRRLKTHISNLNYGLKEIMAMQPVSYNWKTTPDVDTKLGLIAQEVRNIVPEIVKGDEAKEDLSIAYSDLIPVLINAIKEQQKQIDELKKMVQELKNGK